MGSKIRECERLGHRRYGTDCYYCGKPVPKSTKEYQIPDKESHITADLVVGIMAFALLIGPGIAVGITALMHGHN